MLGFQMCTWPSRIFILFLYGRFIWPLTLTFQRRWWLDLVCGLFHIEVPQQGKTTSEPAVGLYYLQRSCCYFSFTDTQNEVSGKESFKNLDIFRV
jgi:hypothetical protein